MNKSAMEKYALQQALALMGEFAWPTVVLGIICVVGYIATPWMVLQGQMSWIIGVPVMAVCVYAVYTVMHDSAHGAIAGRYRRVLWLNNAMGYLAGFVIGMPFTAHRYEHITHHRHTNDPARDPDHHVSGMKDSPWQAIRSGWEMILANYTYYFSVRWGRVGWPEKSLFLIEMTVSMGARIGCVLLFGDLWWQALLLLLVGPSLGVVVLIYLFAYIVHHPHEAKGRYLDTSTIEVAGGLNRIVTLAWLFQNYHSIHHLYPKVPFYRYRQLFNRIEQVMRMNGSPIYQLSWSGLEVSQGTASLNAHAPNNDPVKLPLEL